MQPTVSVSIVNWNGLRHIKKCLDSVYQQRYKGNIEIIIVDNFSQDNSLQLVEDNFKGITILRNSSNKGFSYAHNQAVRASQGKFILFLNFDIFLEPMFIDEMVKTMQENHRIGVVSGKLYKQIDGNKSNIIDSTGIMMEHCFMRPRGEMEVDNLQYDSPTHKNVFGVCGAAAFCRREALEDIKYKDEYFDEDFINYVEDVDLSWRLQLRDWFCLYNPKAIAYHERGVTRKENRTMQRDYLVYGFRNRYCSMLKNLTIGNWKKNKKEILTREAFFLLSKIKEIPYSVKLKAIILALGMSGKMFTKRRIIQRRQIANEQRMADFFRYDKKSFNGFLLQNLSIKLAELKNKLKIKKFSRTDEPL